MIGIGPPHGGANSTKILRIHFLQPRQFKLGEMAASRARKLPIDKDLAGRETATGTIPTSLRRSSVIATTSRQATR